jgi:hypothetical protein
MQEAADTIGKRISSAMEAKPVDNVVPLARAWQPLNLVCAAAFATAAYLIARLKPEN